MGQDGPFDESEQTIMRPTPGGRRAHGAAAEPAPPPPAADLGAAGFSGVGVNSLLAAAASIIELVGRLKFFPSDRDAEVLRTRVIGEIKEFESRAFAAQVPPETVRTGRYALCATVDDVVLNTPWGSRSMWSRSSMVGTFHNEVQGGERFFELLENMHRNPGGHLDVLELMYVCLSLGFEGKYRVLPRGSSELGELRHGLYRMLRENRGDFERDLSPRWRGLEKAHRPLASFVPFWVIGVAAAAALAAIFTWLSFSLNASSDEAVGRLAALPPSGPVTIARRAPPPAPVPVPVVAPPKPQVIVRTVPAPAPAGFLEAEVRAGTVVVIEDAQTITVRIRSAGIFASGRATVRPHHRPLLERVARALNKKPGRIVVEGHTDNVPIRSIRFPSNWHLSMARAEAVIRLLMTGLDDARRLSAVGLGAARPRAANTTAEGRETNRRIEIILMKKGTVAE